MVDGMAQIGRGGRHLYNLATALDLPLTQYFADHGGAIIEGNGCRVHEQLRDDSMRFHAKEARARGLRKLKAEDKGQLVRTAASLDMGWRTRRDANHGSSEAIDDGNGFLCGAAIFSPRAYLL
jgi:hypothetical protein